MTVASVYDASTAVHTALAAVTTLTVYDGRVSPTPPKDAAGRVKPYAVLYAGPGAAHTDRYDDGQTELAWRCQVTVAAGTPAGALVAIDWVRAALTGLRLDPTNPGSGLLREDGDPGPLRRDDAVPDDPRWWTPLQFVLDT